MTFRFARHTNSLEKLKKFYTQVLHFEILGSFENHNGYNGIFIGKQNQNWHLEFTENQEKIEFTFGEDDMLVFYPQTQIEYQDIINSIIENNVQLIKSKNPYWNENGKMFLDPDGYRIVVSKLKVK
ncbi:VOC family protein [Flavobacterium sp.]|uniref:VOC family protein n=1 Tax=Flavobacterium sp. TaxID=239 RepID=UPI0035281B7E